MKPLLMTILFFTILSKSLFAQYDSLAILSGICKVNEFEVKPDGEIWVATRTGMLCYANNPRDSWHIAFFNYLKKNQYQNSEFFTCLKFLNKDTGLILSNSDVIYRTTDGGKTISINNAKYISIDNSGKQPKNNKHFIGDSGNIWILSDCKTFYYSADFGKTWEKKGDVVAEKKFNLLSLYFTNKNYGITGGYGNELFITKDNCEKWTRIETPLDQKIYKRYDNKIRPEFSKVLLFKDWIIVCQENKFFYTKEAKIEWKRLTNCIDISYDTQNDKLWIVNKDLTCSLLDNNLSKVWTSKEKFLDTPDCIKAANKSLYFSIDEYFGVCNESEYYISPMYTKDLAITRLNQTIDATFITWGFNENHIYQSLKNKEKWCRIIRMPFSVYCEKVKKDSICILSNQKNERFLFNSQTKTYKPIIYEKPLQEFLKHPIEKIIVETGFDSDQIVNSSGDISHGTKVQYSKKGKSIFSVSEYKKYKEDINFPDSFKNELNIKEIYNLLKEINDNPYQKVHFSDFKITNTDKNNYMEFISKLENNYKQNRSLDYNVRQTDYIPLNKTIFEFYKYYLDSLLTFNDEQLNDILSQGDYHESTGGSACTNLRIINKKGNVLWITNYYNAPNAWLVPWTIRIGDIRFKSMNLNITKFIQKNTPGFIPDKLFLNDYLLFQIITQIYLERIKE